mgnify:CR=1 FL=1
MTFNSDTIPRKLWYPLNRVAALNAITEGDAQTSLFEWASTDNDEPITITLTLSLNEYVALASSIDVGMDIAYNQDALKIWWIWIRASNTMALCDQVADCIETSQTVQNTLNETIINQGQVNPDTIDPTTPEVDTRFPPDNRDEPISSSPVSCDKDELWAGILETVTRLDDNAKQFLDQAVAQADKAERAAQIIGLVPIIGDLAAESILIFSEVAPDLQNLFIAHTSQANLEATACALFELVCDECRYPTYDEYFEHFANQGISGLDDIGSLTFLAITDLLFGTQNLLASVCWHTMIAYELYVLYLGSTWTSFRGIKWLDIWAKLGQDDASSDWEILCEGCEPDWCYEWDFLTTNGNWSGCTGGQGKTTIWTNGIGWQAESGSGEDQTGISRVFTSVNIKRVELTYTETQTPSLNRLYTNGALCASSSPLYDPNDVIDNGDGTFTAEWSWTDQDFTAFKLYQENGGSSGLRTFIGLRIEGTGINPFDGGSDC